MSNPTPQPGEAPPLNANKISIITKSDIRYEGILYHINPQDQNITLCNVRSFGTEGRRPGDEIAPSLQITPYICFRGTDIKDLKVLESPQQGQGEATANEAKPTQAQPVDITQANVKQPTGQQDTQAPKEEQKEFDFQSMKAKFEQFTSEHKSNINVKNYQQNDFFDNLSTSTGEKARDIPFDRVAQKNLDKETFGSEYVDTATHRGGRGGHRRGGRGGNYRGGGGYRGGHRGGYRNYGGNQGNYGGSQGGNYNQGSNYNQGGNQGGYNQGGNYGGQRRYGGGQGNYGGHRNEGGQGNYGGHREGGQGNYGGHREGGQGNYGGHREGGQGNYGGHREGGYRQGGHGGDHGGQGGYNQGQRYYKSYQSIGGQQGEEGRGGEQRRYGNQNQNQSQNQNQNQNQNKDF